MPSLKMLELFCTCHERYSSRALRIMGKFTLWVIQMFSMLSLLHNLFNNYISFHTRIPGKDIIHTPNNCNFQEWFCRGQTGYNDSECKVQHRIRMYNHTTRRISKTFDRTTGET